MHWYRTVSVFAATLVAVLAIPAFAGAAIAPTLQSPAATAPAATEGSSLDFEWSGTLQGDPDALGRSFFRLEIIRASDVPSGAQSAWPAASLENFLQTDPGAAQSSAKVGVPSAGEYRWRVCAWGVADDSVANVIAQLPGGCSASRTFSTVAAATTTHAIGELKVQETNQVAGATRTVAVRRPAGPAQPGEPAQPVEPVDRVEPAPEEPVEEVLAPAGFTSVQSRGTEEGGTSALGLGTEGLFVDTVANREGIVGSIIDGLTSILPLIRIPFWTLALLLACFPILRSWRRSVLGMFDWRDGSVDGRGTFAGPFDHLASVPLAQEVKVASATADGTAAAPAPVVKPLAPDRGRRAA